MAETPESGPGELSTAAALAEQGFLAAGQRLEAAVAILDRLAERFAHFINGLTGDALVEIHRELTHAADNIASLAEARRADTGALDELHRITTTAQQRIVSLQPIASQVETLSLSARVVAGGMGSEASDFAAFAHNIRDAGQRARCCLTEASDALSHMNHDLSAARADIDAFDRVNGATMRAIPARLADNLRSLAGRQQIAASAATAAHQRSEAVGRQVAEQIVALQLGDITRQRIEHVETALQLLAKPQHQVGSLLAAQLNDAADELLHEGSRIEAGLGQLVLAARAIGQLGIQVHGEAQTGGFVAALEADLRHTTELFNRVSADDAETRKRMTTVLDAADMLALRLASVQSVQEDVRLMGLNATLKCGRLGAIGRPLAAIAQELRLCSGRFGVQAASVLEDLGHLRSVAIGLQDPSRRDKHAAIAQAADAMMLPLQQLSDLEDQLAATLHKLQDDADEVGELVEAAVSQFAVRLGLAQTLRAEAAGLAAWADTDSDASEQLDRIAAIYTMAREREVHARFAPLPREAEPADVSGILF